MNPTLSTTAHVTWQLINDEAGGYYCAKLDLYNALDEMDSYGYDVEKYEAIYNDSESTTEDLAEAAAILEAGLELTQSVELAEWSDYPIFFEDDMEHPLVGTALHFHLSESRARSTEVLALDNLWLELPWWY